MSQEQIDRAASFLLYVISVLIFCGGFALIIASFGCAFRWFPEQFCTPDAVAARRVFFLEGVAGLVAAWAGLKIVEGRR